MYAPLKVTTEYSLLKSLIKIPNLITFLCENEINACGICDENLYGVLDFYYTCKKNSVKPIIGLDVLINDKHIYLYAMNYNGYKSLIKLNSIKEKCDLSIADLELYKKDLLVIVPYSSVDLYEPLNFIKYRFIGYKSLYEKNNAKILTNDILYINDLRALSVNDLKYMEYLDILRKEPKADYSSNYYQKLDIIDNREIERVISLLNVDMPEKGNFIPKYKDGISSDNYLNELCIKGLTKRLHGHVTEDYKKRLSYELSVITKMGYVDYFLIVYDYVLYAKKNNILVGPGRGSAAGSLVSYSIGITDIDPIKYNLLFERFLNPERVTMPDIDVDFDATKRELVLDYVRNRYGLDKVAIGLTFNTLKSKLVLREIGKIKHLNQNLLDRFLKCIEPNLDLKRNLDNETVKKYLNTYPEVKEVYNIAMHLENLKRNTSTHAAGVILSNTSLEEIIPIHYNGDILQTGVTMDYLEDIGLLKMDFLGLKNLTTIANIIKNIPDFDFNKIDLNDKKVYELFKSGKTEGIFQFETPSMKRIIEALKPNNFNDLIIAIALDRPGPKDYISTFIKRHHGEENVTYLDPSLESILKETEGILIYQEQIMAILQKVAGWSLAEADLVRRAISKKKDEIIKQNADKFINAAIGNGYKKDVAIKIYDDIAKFASYGFNKSHSVAYATVAYELAYLKTYYPALFIIELLNDSKDINKNNTYLAYLKSKNIILSKPNVNVSEDEYFLKDNNLVMPLWVIKGINRDVAIKIVTERKNNYHDYFDFVCKTKDFINENILEILINSGALDSFNLNHQTMIKNINSAYNYAEIADPDGLIAPPAIVEYPEYDKDIINKQELEYYGFYITNHPASRYNSKDIIKLNRINNYLFKKVKCVLLISNIKGIKTKNNEDMAFLSGNDETESIELTVFPRNYSLLDNIHVGDLVEISGEVVKRFDKVQIIINNIRKMGD